MRWSHVNRAKHVRLMKRSTDHAVWAIKLEWRGDPVKASMHLSQLDRLVDECGCSPKKWPKVVYVAMFPEDVEVTE